MSRYGRAPMSTFITRLDGGGTGPRLAVKDLIDVASVPTTAGSKAVADTARPATADAPCMAGVRAADARIVRKANLHELAFGATVGRFRLPDVDPEIDAAVDAALAVSELEVVAVELPGWQAAWATASTLMVAEAWDVDHHLLERRQDLGDDVAGRIELGGTITPEQRELAEAGRRAWQAELATAFVRVEVIALPTLPVFPPPIEGADELHLTTATAAVNLAG